MMGEDTEEEFYEISAVSRLTGLSTHVLRVWERRYGVVEPDRTETRRRRYTRDDIRRLSLLKSLVDHGHTISSIAKLEMNDLEARLAEVLESSKTAEDDDGSSIGPCRIGMIAVQARNAIRDAADSASELSIAAEFQELGDMVANVKPGVIDLLIIEMGSLFEDDLREIRQAVDKLSARRAIVIYQFAADEVVEPGNIEKVIPLRAPVTTSEILLACSADIHFSREAGGDQDEKVESGEDLPEEIPSRIYSSEQLVSISKRASVVKCECPQHLSQLLESLSAFEEYSRLCENRNEEDAKLHAFLHRSTAQCRRQMEEALARVIKAEGIQL